MPNKVFTVTEVPGSKRASERDYTHAVIGQYNFALALESADKIHQTDIDNHNYYLATSKMKAGDTVYVTDCYKPWNYPQKQDTIDKAIEHVNRYKGMTAEQYAYDRQLDRLVELTERYEEAGGRYVVLRWSQSQANAAKGHTEFSMYTNLKVVETTRIK